LPCLLPQKNQRMFEQTFKNIDDILHKDAGCTSELDYTEQSSWLLFLKYLDALEADKALEQLPDIPKKRKIPAVCTMPEVAVPCINFIEYIKRTDEVFG